jgi:hypothetical protein
MIGHARLVDDRDKKKSVWKFEYAAFFPNGPEANDSVLIEFTPQRIEIMHFHMKNRNLALEVQTSNSDPQRRILGFSMRIFLRIIIRGKKNAVTYRTDYEDMLG